MKIFYLKKDKTISVFKSNEFTLKSRREQLSLINDTQDDHSPIQCLMLNKAYKVIKYLLENQLATSTLFKEDATESYKEALLTPNDENILKELSVKNQILSVERFIEPESFPKLMIGPCISDVFATESLNLAVLECSLKKVNLLLADRVDPNTLNNLGRTPLIAALCHIASYHDKNIIDGLKIIRILINYPKTDVNISDDSGRTLLHHVLRQIADNVTKRNRGEFTNELLAILKMLMDAGVNIDIRDNKDRTIDQYINKIYDQEIRTNVIQIIKTEKFSQHENMNRFNQILTSNRREEPGSTFIADNDKTLIAVIKFSDTEEIANRYSFLRNEHPQFNVSQPIQRS